MNSFAKGIGIGLVLGLLVILGCFLWGPDTLPESDSGQTQTPAEISEEALPEDPVSGEISSFEASPSEDSALPEPSPEGDTAPEPDAEPTPEPEPDEDSQPSEAVLAFAGDVMFSEQSIASYDQNGIRAFADAGMLSAMQEADLFIINEEFPFSLRGEAMEDKQYTFRTDPKYISIFQELGVDLVTVANNHALDFGRDAFLDTLDTLKQAGITSIGGGRNITEASAPAVYTIHGQTFAVFAATRVSPSYDWYAADSQPGLFQTYDPARLNQAIAGADALYDHVIVFVHWGIERSETPEDYQHSLAKGYIDAGADLIIGCHPHVLQGFEYYQGVPIVYSLGNYLFGNRSGDTLLLNAVFSGDGSPEIRLLPCRRENGVLTSIQDPSSLYQHLTDLSFGAAVSPEGYLVPADSP